MAAKAKKPPKKPAAKAPKTHDTAITTDGRAWDVRCGCGFKNLGIPDHEDADAAAEAHEPGSSARHHGGGRP